MRTPTIADAARRIAANELSPVELTRHCLDRIDQLDSTFHAFLAVTSDRALADAAASEGRARAGARRGPLDGIPIAHKDIFATAGVATSGHSRQLAGAVPERDAAVVAALERAGAVLLGKLNCYEFAFAGPAYDLPWPPSCNPWDVTRTTAGSSSGTAAAVALGMALGGTGSDTGGSLRDPAALCGVVGLKPTYGLCSRDGMLPFAWSLDHPGPIAWTAEDCALLLQAMAGIDVTSTIGGGARGVRIGVVRHWHEVENEVSAATHTGLDRAVVALGDLGADIREVKLPRMDEYHACGSTIALSELRAVHEHRLRAGDADRYGSLLRQGLALAGTLGAEDYVQATRRRRELCRRTADAMRDVDLVLTAMQDGEAPPMREALGTLPFEKPNFTMPFNVTGQPAISVATGFGMSGLPVAMQLAAKPFHEALLVRVAHAYEAATPWRDTRPHDGGGVTTG